MYDVFSSLKNLIKISDTVTDNFVFKLHYQLTCMILIMFSVVVTTNQFFGSPINCFTTMKEVPENVLDSYCWIHSTFTLPRALSRPVGDEVPFPGVDKAVSGDEVTYHQYYQWVCFFLFFQAILFYVPRYVWKIAEGKTISKVVLGLNSPILEENEKEATNVRRLARYLLDTFGRHQVYAFAYVGCEVLNFVNVIGQMYFTDLFLDGEFTTYGTRVVQFANTNQAERSDPMVAVFPRVTKCTFNKFGASGDVQNHSALCVLPINIINEKIFIFLWFWYIILAIISGLDLLYRIVMMSSRALRWKVTISRNTVLRRQDMKRVMEVSNYGDWFFLHLLSKNVSSLHYSSLVQHVVDIVEEREDGAKETIPLCRDKTGTAI